MAFKVVAVDMIASPNTWAVLPKWTVTSPNPQVLWFNLNVVDQLGERRYLVQPGATLEVTFPRASLIQRSAQSQAMTYTNRDVVKMATVSTYDRSQFSINLTAADIQNIRSGTVLFKLTEGPNVTTWNQNWFITKNLIDAGT